MIVTIGSMLCAAAAVTAQCREWRGGFGVNGVGSTVDSLAAFDDGSGPALFIGGSFNYAFAGDVTARGVARWDGEAWSTVGAPISGQVRALVPWNDGGGTRLWAAGDFLQIGGTATARLASWDGSAWSGPATGPNAVVRALAAFDDGAGSRLYAGGDFTLVAGVPSGRIARFDGTTWTALGTGANASVRALCVYDDGTGPKLFAAGNFTSIDGVAATRIARFDGTSWTALGSGLNSEVRALCVHDDGSGPKLIAGGNFSLANGVPVSCIAAWNGSAWSALGSGVNWYVNAFTTYDDGAGPKLYAGGEFNFPSGRIARWNGSSWSAVGSGIAGTSVNALAPFDVGSGARLCAGGAFGSAGGVTTQNIAAFDGTAWSRFDDQWGLNDNARAFETFDDGTGQKLFVSGDFTRAGDVLVNSVARWNGSSFEPLPAGPFGSLYDMQPFDDGTGTQLYVGGIFSTPGSSALSIARWNGSAWSTPASGIGSGGWIEALSVFDPGVGPGLYVGGNFVTAGGLAASRIARYDGNGWSSLENGLGGTCNALCVFDDGLGPALYVGGNFATAGSGNASGIARWNAAGWSALGAGVGGIVKCLHVFDDGSGPALYVGGDFSGAGATGAIDIARWDGTSWSELPGLMPSVEVTAFESFDDGTGTALYAGGRLPATFPNLFVARWNGSGWSSVGADFVGGPPGVIDALHAHDDGTGAGPSLWAGGWFFWTGERYSQHIAAWQGCPGTGEVFCFGDGSGTNCPCGNASVVGAREGCVNSTSTAGALRASGTPSLSADSLVLEGSQMTNGTALYFQGTTRANGGAGLVFGDGLRCAGGTTVRLDITFNTSGASMYPQAGDAPTSVQGQVGAPGTRTYQVWYRDAGSFCTTSTFNLTNAIEIGWTL